MLYFISLKSIYRVNHIIIMLKNPLAAKHLALESFATGYKVWEWFIDSKKVGMQKRSTIPLERLFSRACLNNLCKNKDFGARNYVLGMLYPIWKLKIS